MFASSCNHNDFPNFIRVWSLKVYTTIYASNFQERSREKIKICTKNQVPLAATRYTTENNKEEHEGRMAEALRELEAFLEAEVRADLQDQALQHILGVYPMILRTVQTINPWLLFIYAAVSGDDGGRKLFLEAPGVVKKLLEAAGRWQKAPALARDATLALINLAASPVLVDTLLKQVKYILITFLLNFF
jgi:hypothetical protein